MTTSFPIKIGTKSNLKQYAAKLVDGQEQLLITRDGGLYLSSGNGDYIECNNNVQAIEGHIHENKEVLDKFSYDGKLLYDGKQVSDSFALSRLAEYSIDIDVLANSNSNATTSSSIPLGSKLTYPEAGWKRIDCCHPFMVYEGTWQDIKIENDNWGEYIKNSTGGINDAIKFKFRGTKLRLIGRANAVNRNTVEYIYIDGKKYSFTQLRSTGVSFSIDFHIQGLDNATHNVEIKKGGTASYCIDAIDIDSTGSIIEILDTNLEFPIKVGDSENLELYARTLVDGQEQLLITRDGELFLTDGDGSYIQCGVSLEKYEELEKRISALEELNRI